MDEDLEELEKIVLSLREAIRVVRASLIETGLKEGILGSINRFQDANGRFILPDLYVAYANAYVAWVNLKTAINNKSCNYRNGNSCVIKGCDGRPCIKKEQ